MKIVCYFAKKNNLSVEGRRVSLTGPERGLITHYIRRSVADHKLFHFSKRTIGSEEICHKRRLKRHTLALKVVKSGRGFDLYEVANIYINPNKNESDFLATIEMGKANAKNELEKTSKYYSFLHFVRLRNGKIVYMGERSNIMPPQLCIPKPSFLL